MILSMIKATNVIKELSTQIIRKKFRVMLGGQPITQAFAEKLGADAGVSDAVIGAKICQERLKMD